MIPVKILAILLLVGTVTKFGHPLRAAIVFGLITGGLEALAGAPLEQAAIRGVASFLLSAVIFWVIDRTDSILLGTIVTVAGVAALVAFG